jgi:pheromone shutdown protein TraB
MYNTLLYIGITFLLSGFVLFVIAVNMEIYYDRKLYKLQQRKLMNDINKMKAMSKDFENLLNEDYKETMKPKIKTTNPFSGQSIDLTFEERDLYSTIKRAEKREDYDTMQKAIDKFSRLNPKAYRVLVD